MKSSPARPTAVLVWTLVTTGQSEPRMPRTLCRNPRPFKARLARVARIEIEHVSHPLVEWLVRMAKHNHIRPVAVDLAPQGVRRLVHVNNMVHQEPAAGEFDHLGLFET